MTNAPAPGGSETARDLRVELTEAVTRRFGGPRAAALEAEIAGAAETLARVAAVSFAPDAHEPDYIGSANEAKP